MGPLGCGRRRAEFHIPSPIRKWLSNSVPEAPTELLKVKEQMFRAAEHGEWPWWLPEIFLSQVFPREYCTWPSQSWKKKKEHSPAPCCKNSLALSQAVNNVTEDGHLEQRQKKQALNGPGLQASNMPVQHSSPPEIQDVMKSNYVGHQRSQEAAAMAFMLKLMEDLVHHGPVLWTKSNSLREELNGRRHGGLLQVSKVNRITVGMVDQQVLKKAYWIVDRDKLHCNEVLVLPEALALLSHYGMATQPLKKGEVFVLPISLEV